MDYKELKRVNELYKKLKSPNASVLNNEEIDSLKYILEYLSIKKNDLKWE